METKKCVDCKRELPLDQFYKRKPAKDSHTTTHTGQCKSCRIVTSKKYWKEHIGQHRKMVNKRYKTFRRFAKYGLSLEGFHAMLAKQGGKCALCKDAEPGGKGAWHIDHVGGTNRKVYNQCTSESVRGLLCHRCNVSLGHYEKLLGRVGKDSVIAYLNVNLKE